MTAIQPLTRAHRINLRKLRKGRQSRKVGEGRNYWQSRQTRIHAGRTSRCGSRSNRPRGAGRTSRCGSRSNRPRRLWSRSNRPRRLSYRRKSRLLCCPRCRCGCRVDGVGEETFLLPRIVELRSGNTSNVLHESAATIPRIPVESLTGLQSQTTFPARPRRVGPLHPEVTACNVLPPYARTALEE